MLKLIWLGESGDTRWPATDDAADPYYWRREAHVYESGLLGRLVGVRAPELRASIERGDGTVALWLEEVPEPPPWTPERLGTVAHGLGRSQAAFARDLPDQPWLARRWLRRYLELHGVTDEAGVLDRLEAMPQTLVHNDPHPANVLGAAGEIVIDWAYCGLGPLGGDVGVLVADGLADEAIAPGEADAAAELVVAGYLAGLRAEGWAGREDDVRYAYLAGTALRLSWLERGRKPSFDATIDLLDRWSARARELA